MKRVRARSLGGWTASLLAVASLGAGPQGADTRLVEAARAADATRVAALLSEGGDAGTPAGGRRDGAALGRALG